VKLNFEKFKNELKILVEPAGVAGTSTLGSIPIVGFRACPEV
jgi:hypothetical protein